MLRIISGVVAGFFCWVILWFGMEAVLSAAGPAWFGAQQEAFQRALMEDEPFQPESRFLITHIVCGAIATLVAGFLSAVVAGENRRAPKYLGLVLLALGVLKAVLSWPYVPIWYHITFTAMLYPLTLLGAKLALHTGSLGFSPRRR